MHQITPSHCLLAKRLLFQHKKKDFRTPDALEQLVALVFSEEEALVANHVSVVASTAKTIARRAGRPLGEIEPILKRLSDRFLILSHAAKNDTYYVMMPLVPGVFESQMIQNRGQDTPYAREFARLFEDFYAEFGGIVTSMLGGKEVKLSRVIPIEESVKSSNLNIIPYPTDMYSEMVDRNKSFALVDCSCRDTAFLVGQPCKKPKDVCTGMGIVADIIIDKGLARRVTKEEFMEVKTRAWEAGLVNMADNMQDPLQLCSCCGCCCIVLRLANKYNAPALIASSHFEALVDSGTCNGCGACAKWCPMYAITLKDKKAEVDHLRCIGCGVCVGKCTTKTMALQARKDYRPPQDNIVSHFIERFFEYKGYNPDGVLPRATLGIGRVLSRFVQPKLSGPKYNPMK